ncbi:hypothetical protein, partial [Mesorhizobium sp.]|uniref:hypothetical protein n=1 Tax=Mesorhizobium sp. TaxID=1871066 RepID=UPI0025EB15A0
MKPQEAKTPAARPQLPQSIDECAMASVKLGGISMKTSSGAAAQKMISTTVYPGGRNHLTDAKRTR